MYIFYIVDKLYYFYPTTVKLKILQPFKTLVVLIGKSKQKIYQL